MTKDLPRKKIKHNLKISSQAHTLPKHPLNVKPSGNQILASLQDLEKLAKSSGPFFGHLPDAIIFQILGFLDRDSLFKSSHSCKFFYAFANFEELWRNLYTLATPEERIEKRLSFPQWRGSWRSSIMRLELPWGQIDCGFVYSDLLFKPYSNSQINYALLLQQTIEEQKRNINQSGYLNIEDCPNPISYPYKGRIPRLDESTLTYEAFENNWSNHPFIIGSKDKDWVGKRWSAWDMKYLLEEFPNVKFRQESVQWPLELYFDYSNNNSDESPLYLFDCRSKAFEKLIPAVESDCSTNVQRYYPNPPAFAPKDKDMLSVFDSCRPDHTWLITGPARSGSTWHKDPNSTDAWNVVIQGAKIWIMFPSEVTPPGVFTDSQEGEVVAPIGVAEWVTSGFWNDSLKLIDETNSNGVIGVTFEGECMYVPAGWWHTVINIEDSVALTANFVPSCKLGKALQFMKEKKGQVSGFRHDLLQRFLKSFLAKQGKDEAFDVGNGHGDNDDTQFRLEILKRYLENQELMNEDEDVGELKGTDQMPVYEAFIELLKAKGYEKELDYGFEQMRQIEKEKRKGMVKKSEIWEELTKEARYQSVESENPTTGGFSFGFSFEEDD